MKYNYIYLYNKLIELSRNKDLYKDFNKEDINKINALHERFISEDTNLSTNDKIESIFYEYKTILNEKLGHIQK